MGVKPEARRARRSSYGTYTPSADPAASSMSWWTRRHVVMTAGLVAAAVIIGAGIRGLDLVGKVSNGGFGGVISALTDSSQLGGMLASGQRVNILLLGYGGAGHDGAYLTDSLMVISLNPSTHQAAEISIPRDTEVKIHAFTDSSTYTLQKINTAFAIGMSPDDWSEVGRVKAEYDTRGGDRRDGAEKLAADVVGQFTGLHIDYVAAVDFKGFREAVDDLGGTTVTVPETFTLDYPIGESSAWTTIHFDAGTQRLNGERVLEFVRSRYSGCSETGDWGYRNGVQTCHGWPVTAADQNEATDFARSRRQQIFLQAFRKDALSLNAIDKMPSILSDLASNVRTNMSLADMRSLWDHQSWFADKSVVHISIDNSNLEWDCSYCSANGYTLHLYDDGTVLHRFLDNLFQPQAVREGQAITVYNATSIDNLSGIWADMLGQLGFKTVDGGSIGRQASSVIDDRSGGRASNTIGYLQSMFGAQPRVEAPSSDSTPLVLVLGHDFGLQFINTGDNPTPVAVVAPPPPRPRPSPSPVASPSISTPPSSSPSPTPHPLPSATCLVNCPTPKPQH